MATRAPSSEALDGGGERSRPRPHDQQIVVITFRFNRCFEDGLVGLGEPVADRLQFVGGPLGGELRCGEANGGASPPVDFRLLHPGSA
jgi:hypothetical protein